MQKMESLFLMGILQMIQKSFKNITSGSLGSELYHFQFYLGV